MNGRRIIAIIAVAGSLLVCQDLRAQNPLGRFRGMGSGGGGKSGGSDSLVHRKADTITLNYRYLDSSRLLRLDSSVTDFSKKVPQPATWINLGNMGTPARNLVFSPRMQSGWDPGLHAYDLYAFRTDETKLYHTTKPYTELGYLLGGKSEQIIDITHTQNVKPNWNFAFEYRLINALGAFQNQNSNHNNYRLSSWYQSRNKRYSNFFILVSSKLTASENGGIRRASDLDSNTYSNQSTLPVWLGNNLVRPYSNPFAPHIGTGTRYTTTTYLLRQQYDLGQKDSIVTDTTVIPLFYPRVRLEHTLTYSSFNYQFSDQSVPGSTNYTLDSFYYATKYNINYLPSPDSNRLDTFTRRDRWHDFSNDFSIYQFPDSKNPQQFIKLGATLQLLKGRFDTASLANGDSIRTVHQFNGQNVFVHGEYRNKTRNQKWDIEAYGKLYLNGLNSGDYNAYISLKRLVSRQVGYLEVGFQNINRTPSFVFDRASSFHYDTAHNSFKKENITNIFASLDLTRLKLKLTGAYYLMSNYAYFQDYYKQQQESSLFNLLQVTGQKQFTLYRHWKWRALAIVQQVAGSSPVHVPFLILQNQIGYDGSLGFKNLQASIGTEIRYVSSYKADGYAPLNGQFFSQNDSTIRQHLPDINLYTHFRIRSFTAYVRVENLNAIAFGPNGFGFYHNNFVGPGYLSPGMVIRIGVFWGFVN